MNKNKDNKYFYITNFYTATFLLAKDLELANIDRTNPSRCQFAFVDTPQRRKLLEAFNFAKENSPEIMIDARKLITAIKSLKDKLYQNV